MATASSLFPPFLTGSFFGAALLLATVHTPTIILSQLRLQSTHMLKAFLTASSCSAIIIYISHRLGFAKLPCRTNTSYGWFGSYDANLVGGLLQGLGMALTGACPGTVLVQLALGIESAKWVALGGVLGGMAFVFVGDTLRRKVPRTEVREHTVMQRLKVSEEGAVLGYEVMLISAIAFVDRSGLSKSRENVWVDPVRGGLLVGLAQAASVLLCKKTLGVSSAYSDIGSWLQSTLIGKKLSGELGNICFALGVMAGAKLISLQVPVVADSGAHAVSLLQALLGGFVGIFGARMAGGCTSGHGISGMSTLSISSFVTVAGMFGGGILFRLLLNALYH